LFISEGKKHGAGMLAGSAEMCNNKNNNSKVLLERSYIDSERLTSIDSKICGIYKGYKYKK